MAANVTTPVRIGLGVVVSTAVASLALVAGRFVPIPGSSFVPPSFVTHSVMLLLSLVIIRLVPRRSFGDFGFTARGYRFKPTVLLWVLPTAVVSSAAIFASGEQRLPGPALGLNRVQVVLFVWVWASICEEALTRGLLQTLVAGGDARAPRPRRLTTPVIVSALFFGAMHVVLVPSMGAAAAGPIVLATLLGFVAAHYRESTGSLLPAILVHGLFNIGGVLPLWVVEWARA